VRSETATLLHPFFNFVRECAEREPGIEKVMVFGSRARGDAGERSDFDIAFVAPELSDERWAHFCLHLRDSAPTLCDLDLLRLDDALRSELREHILKEGITIYERK